uniref:Uncharacterized protein n=1 Tax=Rhizophora mucronata TaxID=61149 RepID=A0A2P2PSI3_RHIMU
MPKRRQENQKHHLNNYIIHRQISLRRPIQSHSQLFTSDRPQQRILSKSTNSTRR